MRRIALCASSVAALAVIGACREPTEIEVEISSDACARVRGEGVTIAVADSPEAVHPRAPSASQPACTDTTGTVGSIVLVPSGDKGARVAIEVALHLTNDADCGAVGEKCIVARRVLRYARHTRLVLPIALREVCAGVRCPVEQTCSQGICVSAELQDPDACALAGTCPDGSGANGSGGASDGGLRDGASDARDKDASSVDAWAPSGDGGCAVVPGARPESPGVVDCPAQPCSGKNQTCCILVADSHVCEGVPPTGDCTQKMCDEDADCGHGNVCCAFLSGVLPGPFVTTYLCTPNSCPIAQVHVCKTVCACVNPELPCTYSQQCGIATCGGQCPH